MSIEKRAGTFSRSARTLIKQRGEPLHIKVLQTLGGTAMHAIDIKVFQTLGMARDRPSLYGERGGFLRCYRSAGACPPRALSTAVENARSPETADVCLWLRPVRGEGQALALR